MNRKRVLIVSDRAELSGRVARALSTLDLEIAACPVTALLRALSSTDLDAIVFDVAGAAASVLEAVEKALAERNPVPVLAVVSAEDLERLRLPVRISSDFIVEPWPDAEMAARMKNLVWPGGEAASHEFITSGKLSINLATYQVYVDGEVIELTYLEYALLAFLVTHPGRTYDRDALLRRVWGFEYYGGSRTVDVHVRRIRAKLGPEVSQYLETVRGVGYLWNG